MLRHLALFALLAGSTAAAAPTLVKAAHLLDGVSDRPRDDAAVLVDGDAIVAVGAGGRARGGAPARTVIDLGDMTLLPGLDRRAHARVPPRRRRPGVYDAILFKKSSRTARCGGREREDGARERIHDVRDLETEGAMYTDVDVKPAIENGVMPGPRMVVATRAISVTGMYPLRGYKWELDDADGRADRRRRRSGPQGGARAGRHGADWIKVYADRRLRWTSPTAGALSSSTSRPRRWKRSSTRRTGSATKSRRTRMAGTASTRRCAPGVDSIEHGQGLTDDLIDADGRAEASRGARRCSRTSYAEKKLGPTRALVHGAGTTRRRVARAYKRGVRIVFGTDAGRVPVEHEPRRRGQADGRRRDAGDGGDALDDVGGRRRCSIRMCKPGAKTCAKSERRRDRARQVRRPRRGRRQPARGHHASSST